MWRQFEDPELVRKREEVTAWMAKAFFEERQRRKLSCRAVARAVNISISTVNQLENQRHVPTLRTAKRLSEFYGISIENVDSQIFYNKEIG